MNKEDSFHKTLINWYPGHMAKTKRLIKEKYDLIDIVYELVDARIPYSSKISDIDSLLLNKTRILIMSKKDLCDEEETKKWMQYYEELGYHVLLIDFQHPTEYQKIIDLTHDLMSKMQEKRKDKGLKKKEIKALVIGVPNVGKSTLINKLAGKKVVSVGNRPGVTTSLSWIKTNNDILLLDSPGILWPKFENNEIALNLASCTAIKEEILDEDEIAWHILEKLNSYYPHILKERYNIISLNSDFYETYDFIGKKFGYLLQGGEINYERVSKRIIQDIKEEVIKGITFDRFRKQ